MQFSKTDRGVQSNKEKKIQKHLHQTKSSRITKLPVWDSHVLHIGLLDMKRHNLQPQSVMSGSPKYFCIYVKTTSDKVRPPVVPYLE